MRSGKKATVAAAAAAVGARSVAALAVNEPASGCYLGAWVDTSVAGADTPAAFIQRTQMQPQVFVLEQTIPLTPYNATFGTGGAANASFVEVTGTDAHVFLNVVPSRADAFSLIQQSDYDYVASQVAAWSGSPYNRKVYVNYAPRMNDPEVVYGLQPTEFVSSYQKMHDAVKGASQDVAMVWMPTASEGYPFGTVLGSIPNTADQTALDTDEPDQHVLTNRDDAYSPYYPQDQYVDWIGLWYEYRGPKNPLDENLAQPVGTIDGALTGNSMLNLSISGGGGTIFTPWYSTYCAGKTIPCVLMGGAAFHTNTTDLPTTAAAASQNDIQQAWVADGLGNQTFLSAYPQLKMWNLYEFSVVEDYMFDQRDYRLTWDQGILSTFKNSFTTTQGSFLMAQSADIPTDLSGTTPTGVGLSGVSAATGTGRISIVSTLPAQTKSGSVFASGATGIPPVSLAAIFTCFAVAFGVAAGGWIGMR